MKSRQVYRAINGITAELAELGIPKNSQNVEAGYAYRSIDDVLNRLAPLLARHRLCVLPRVLERQTIDRIDEKGNLLAGVSLKVAYKLVSTEDASGHVVSAYGEAHDDADKATAKAMSAAYKSAMLQTFCIPVGEAQDSDFPKGKVASPTAGHQPEPVQGWDQWLRDVVDTLDVCETKEAIGRVQDRNRSLLKAISRERADLYAALGKAFQAKREALAQASIEAKRARTEKRKRPKAPSLLSPVVALPLLAPQDAAS